MRKVIIIIMISISLAGNFDALHGFVEASYKKAKQIESEQLIIIETNSD